MCNAWKRTNSVMQNGVGRFKVHERRGTSFARMESGQQRLGSRANNRHGIRGLAQPTPVRLQSTQLSWSRELEISAGGRGQEGVSTRVVRVSLTAAQRYCIHPQSVLLLGTA